MAPISYAQVPMLLVPVPSNSSYAFNSTFNSTTPCNSTETEIHTHTVSTLYKATVIVKGISCLLQFLILITRFRKGRVQKAREEGAQTLREICGGLEEEFVIVRLEESGEGGIGSWEWEGMERGDREGEGERERLLGGMGEEEYDDDEKVEGEGDFLIDFGKVEEGEGL